MPDNIIYIIFNRPQSVQKTFEVIRNAKPKRLFLVADGPRSSKPGEAEKCKAARELVVNHIDWPCELLTNLAEKNMGCRRRVSSGISWAFEHVEEAVIIEDDCLLSPSFFPFCDEMLQRYRDDPRIMQITANNFIPTPASYHGSYLFSRHMHCWGWATWRRAWQHYDAELSQWESVRQHDMLFEILDRDRALTTFWTNWLNWVVQGKLDSWATVWTFSCWMQHGLCILPRVNMVQNIGMGQPDATHTTALPHWADRNVIEEMTFPLTHPQDLSRAAQRDRKADRLQYGVDFIYRLRYMLGRVKNV